VTFGYDGQLYMLAFDYRASFSRNLLGIEGKPTPAMRELQERRGRNSARPAA
jgi:hypothetical protein